MGKNLLGHLSLCGNGSGLAPGFTSWQLKEDTALHFVLLSAWTIQTIVTFTKEWKLFEGYDRWVRMKQLRSGCGWDSISGTAYQEAGAHHTYFAGCTKSSEGSQ